MREEISGALKEAIKSQDKRRMATLRLISAAIKDRDLAVRGNGNGGVSDDDILQILSKMVKQREESARLYDEAGRVELADQEREEIAIVKEFMPAQLDEAELQDVCEGVVKDIGAHGLRDMGRCMTALKEQYPGRMDFAKASGLVKKLLQ